MTSLSNSDLTPYVTLLLSRAHSGRRQKAHVETLLAEARTLINAIDDDVKRGSISITNPTTTHGLTLGFLHFSESRRPSWLSKDAPIKLEDVTQCLVIVMQLEHFVAFCSSDGPYQSGLMRAIAGSDGIYPTLESLSPLQTTLLNAAFVGGQARTLWLNGVHRSTEVKADTKILSGSNLVRSLNPLGDQTYTFSAVRCTMHADDLIRSTIGVTPRKSRVWSGMSSSYTDFHAQAFGILKHLHKVDLEGTSVECPIPYLALPVTSSASISHAYDLSIAAPELFSDDEALSQEEKALAEKYAYHAQFEVTATEGANCRVLAKIDGEPSGTFDVQVEIAPDGRVTQHVSSSSIQTSSSAVNEQEALAVLGRRDWLSIYYESGHTISRGNCFLQQFTDQQFEGWEWRSFSEYKVDKEKPLNGKAVAFDDIGSRDSLFCYSQKRWSRLEQDSANSARSVWLACDDGANEIADFIRFECGGSTRPRLTLIHVKGSHSALITRQLSVTAYEVVIGQAVKNLRALSTEHLTELLERGGRNATKRFAWLDGIKQSDRNGMIAALSEADRLFDRDVVIVQPSARLSEYSRILPASSRRSSKKYPGWYYRRAQLDGLLIAAQAACFEVGAKFSVVADDEQ
jgi:hypothetical protein